MVNLWLSECISLLLMCCMFVHIVMLSKYRINCISFVEKHLSYFLTYAHVCYVTYILIGYYYKVTIQKLCVIFFSERKIGNLLDGHLNQITEVRGLAIFCFYLTVPESYEKFKSLLAGRTVEQQLTILERIQKCNHPSLAVGNKTKLEVCFHILFYLVF